MNLMLKFKIIDGLSLHQLLLLSEDLLIKLFNESLLLAALKWESYKSFLPWH